MDSTKLKTAFNAFLDEKVIRLTNVHKGMICVVAALLPVVAYYFLSFSPKSQEIGKLKKEIGTLRGEVADAKEKASRLDEHLALKQKIEAQFKEASLLIPDTKEIPSLLTSISSEGTNAGLDILSFVPGGESAKDFYAEIPIAITVNGTYHNVGYFLDTVSKMSRIVNVNDLQLGSPHEVEGELMLNTRINLVTYKFLEQKPQPPASEAQANAKTGKGKKK